MIQVNIPSFETTLNCWELIAPFMKQAADESNGELTVDTIKQRVEERRILIAVVFNDDQLVAAVSFETNTFDSGKHVLQINLAGGKDLHLWYGEIDKLADELAHKRGCSEIYVIGRKGWERQLKNLDYKHTHTIISREVR